MAQRKCGMWWSILYYYVNVQHQAQSYMNYYCRACTSRRCPGATLQIQPFRNYCRDNLSSESVDDQAGIVVTCTSSCAKAWARQRPSSTSRPTHPRRLKHATDCGVRGAAEAPGGVSVSLDVNAAILLARPGAGAGNSSQRSTRKSLCFPRRLPPACRHSLQA